MGTPHYLSPEQCRGRQVDTRTNVYSFGVLTYELLTGKVPFNGADFTDIVFKQLREAPVPPSQIVPDLPAGVDRSIAWMMKKVASKRPATLMAAMRALEHAAEALGVAVPPSSGPGRDGAARAIDLAPPAPRRDERVSGVPRAQAEARRAGGARRACRAPRRQRAARGLRRLVSGLARRCLLPPSRLAHRSRDPLASTASSRS